MSYIGGKLLRKKVKNSLPFEALHLLTRFLCDSVLKRKANSTIKVELVKCVKFITGSLIFNIWVH